MAKIATTIRFTAEEREWIQNYADFSGKTFSEVVREAVLEKIEDAADLLAYNEALVEDDGTRYSLDEVVSYFRIGQRLLPIEGSQNAIR
jgi:predicted DNA-binding protein